MDNEQIRRILIAAGIDYDSALRRMMGKESLYYRFLKKFLEDESYSLLQEALREKRWEDAFCAAHTLKGLTGNLGLTQLYEAIGVLVEKLRHPAQKDIKDTDGPEAFLAELKAVEHAYTATAAAITETLGE